MRRNSGRRHTGVYFLWHSRVFKGRVADNPLPMQPILICPSGRFLLKRSIFFADSRLQTVHNLPLLQRNFKRLATPLRTPYENPPKWVFSKSNFIFPKSNFTIQRFSAKPLSANCPQSPILRGFEIQLRPVKSSSFNHNYLSSVFLIYSGIRKIYLLNILTFLWNGSIYFKN